MTDARDKLSKIQKTFTSNDLNQWERLDRIIFDECHTLLDGRPEIRPYIGQTPKILPYSRKSLDWTPSGVTHTTRVSLLGCILAKVQAKLGSYSAAQDRGNAHWCG
ncbi:hypothetical protein N7490_001668 [Penicillium lividum]|nr:hypothetical protein N7490_001668 [Penicillium lividum]